MKKKMLIVDVIILLISVLVFIVFKLSGAVAIIIAILLAVLFHGVFVYQFKLRQTIEDEERKQSIKEQIADIKEEFPEFADKVNSFADQVNEFEERQYALKKLIALNEGQKGSYLLERSKEAEQCLVQKCNQLRRCLVVMNVLNKDEIQYEETEKTVDEVIKSAENLVEVYSELLTEVNRMGNALEMNDPGLKKAVEKLKAIRSEETQSSSGLFVVKKDGMI